MYKYIDKKLRAYCEKNIIPRYLKLDLAHQPDHVEDVIYKSFQIAQDYEVNINMVYVIAVFHDLGLLIDRKTHHIEGGMLLREDTYINSLFSKEDIITMQEAVEDHRASSKLPPRSVYGKIVSEADRLIEPDKVILRCIQFALSRSADKAFEAIYPSIRSHIKDKYGYGGYLKLWLKTTLNDKNLEDLRILIDDEKKLYEHTKKIFDSMDKGLD